MPTMGILKYSHVLLAVLAPKGAVGGGITLSFVVGFPWWLWMILGVWVCACLVGLFSVSAALLVWAYRRIHGYEDSDPHPPHDRVYLIGAAETTDRLGRIKINIEQHPSHRGCDIRRWENSHPLLCFIRHRRSDGSDYWCKVFGVPLRGASGEVMGIAVTADNYTTVNETSPRGPLDRRQENYRMVFEELAEGFALHEIIWDRKNEPIDCRILDVNPTFLRCVGLSSETLIGRAVSELEPDSIPGSAEQLGPVISGGKPAQFSWCCKRTGKEFNVICYCTGDGRIVTLLLDITARHQVDQEHQQLQEQLHQSRKMEAIGQLAGGIAHDFNNLLTAIQGNAELIQIDPASSAGQLECAEQILEASHRVADLTQQLLAFGRGGNFQTVIVDMHEAIRETAKLLSHGIDRKIEIHQELAATSPTVMGDPSQLKNMLLNLGINARDAMPNGGRITFSTRTVRVDK